MKYTGYAEITNGIYEGYKGILTTDEYNKFATTSNTKCWGILYKDGKMVELDQKPTDFLPIKHWKKNLRYKHLKGWG